MIKSNSLGEAISNARKRKGLSQRQLAKISNINNSELSKIESGIRKNPNPKILRKISNHIDISYNELMNMISIGLEMSLNNTFITKYYLSLDLDKLQDAEINILGYLEHLESVISSCKQIFINDDYLDNEKELLLNTINDLMYKINVNVQILNLIQKRKSQIEKGDDYSG